MTRKTSKPAKAKSPRPSRAAKPASRATPTKKSKPAKPPAKAFIVFGADEYARPRAARFWATDAEPLEKAAAAMKVRLIEVTDPDIAEIMKAIPPGRLHASGQGFLPYVKGETYAELVNSTAIREPLDPAATAETLPGSWDEIGPGHLVIARESLECGWWEAIVVSRENDILTLRYRDYPKAPKFTRHVATIAMVNPGPT